MQIEEAKKYCKQIKDRDLWKVGYVYGSEAIETVLNELEKKDNKIKELEGRCRNLDIEAQSYLEELMGDSTLKNRTIKQLNSELEKKDTVSKKQYNHLKKSLKGEINKLNKELKESQKETMQIYSDYQDIGKIAFDLDEKVQKLIEKLEEDIKVNQENYKTNTDGFEEYWRGCIDTEQEILSILKGEKE